MQDTFNVFETPVDSMRVAAQDITSNQVTNLLNFTESIQALLHLIHFEYIFLVCVTYYIVVTRIPWIKTDNVVKRNMVIALLTIIWGLFGVVIRQVPYLNILVTGLCVNAFYEFMFKMIFAGLERFGLKLPAWYVEDLKQEKLRDIEEAEKKRP